MRHFVDGDRPRSASPIILEDLPSPDRAIEEGDAPVATIMTDYAQQISADAIVAEWHDQDARSPLLLFSKGTLAEALLIEPAPARGAANSMGGDRAARPVTQWQVHDDHDRIAAVMTTLVQAEAGVITIRAAFREVGETTRQRVRTAAQPLAPLIEAFFKLWALRSSAVRTAQGLRAALNSADTPILLLDAAGRLTFTNGAAERLLEGQEGLRAVNGLLTAQRLSDTLRLQAAIEHAIRQGRKPAKVRETAPVIALARSAGLPLMAAVMPADCRKCDCGAIVYIFDPQQDLHPLIEPVCKLYGLSPVETKLTCLLADGVAISAAAEAMHIREQTARTYLKQIFFKTGTKRQAELVWLMLKSSVRTAADFPTAFI